ncbi:ERF family protein [uncultured Sphaerochaeta sp.]|uniref:ERF family protein n=1 Tax=uncultured Sphaerochaeta sp. TaxID=886478 RepID=UPI0029C9EE67|nr:ERF family protein [uncultured Sphaerochaeta sp.]
MANQIFEAMAEVMKDVDAIKKGQQNKSQGFKFRGIDDVYNAVHPIFAKHGVFTVPTVLSERTEERQTRNGGNLIYRILTMKYTFFASDGSSVEAVVIGEGMDSGDKGANKGMAIAHKYALLQTLCIPTEDMIDPDSEVQEPSKKVTSPPQGNRPQPVKRPAPKQGFDPKSASMEEVKSNVEKIFDEKNAIKKVPQNIFTVNLAWGNILRLCDGDKLTAKGLFEQFGAPTSQDITYSIYSQVYDAIQNPDGEQGPELFEGDDLGDVPFESSENIA